MNPFVIIQGLASGEVQQLLKKKVAQWPEKQDSCILFLDYSEFDIPRGTFFTILEDPKEQRSYQVRGELLNIVSFTFASFDEISKGHKTICEIWFDEVSAKFIKAKLPAVSGDGDTSNNLFILKL